MVLKGANCVIWYTPVETFPYIGGVGGIVISWFLSPVFSGLIAALVYGITRTMVLRKDFNTKRINWAYPILIGSTMTINTFFIIYKGAKGLGLDNTPLDVAFGVAFSIGGLSAIITLPLVPKLKSWVEQKFLNNDNHEVELPTIENEVKKNRIELNIKNDSELDRVIALHSNAEKFDERTEEVFKYLQIFTAICDSFSHGANDVANAIGPFAAIYTIYKSGGVLDKNASMEADAYWILGVGGIGIAVGLFVYGKKITYAIGEKLVKITHSRGVAIELSSALVIITGSRLEIPLSTTHCQVGATMGVGLLENPKTCSGINCNVFWKTALGWVLTCIVVGLTTAMFVSQGVYGPSIYTQTCPNAINATI